MSNFRFIQEEWPELFQEAREAEQNAIVRPRYAGVLCRSALEKAILWIYAHDPDIDTPYDTTLNSLMYHQEFKDSLRPTLFNEINVIRKTGNNAAHGKRISDHQSVAALKYLFRFAAYLSRYYSETDPEIPRFDESLIPTGREKDKTIEELRKALAELQKEAEAQRERQQALEAKAEENELLKARLEQQQAVTKARKEVRQQSIGNQEASPLLFTEAETRKNLINVLLQEAGWDPEAADVKEYPVTGMPLSTNRTGRGNVDYVLWGDDALPLAVVEAKKTMLSAKKGKRQAEQYADCLEQMTGQRPIIYYTNGFEYYLWDDLFYPERQVQGFNTKDELQLLIDRRKDRKDIRDYPVNKNIAGRAYQYEAIKRVADHFVTKNHEGALKGKSRKALLVMATGTGKTRTAVALVDVLTKCNWVKRVLFLADRNALVTQAKNAFNEHLPHLSAIDLTKEKEDDGTRLVFSTYPTIMNKIDGVKSGDTRFYGPGHFDLVIIDEAHRSVYVKYRAIFDYFDSLLLGLTATPKKEVDRNTYDLFDIEDDNPTFNYELEKAVNEEFLVPPKAVSVPIKFPREGIKYHELSEKEKAEWEEKFGDPTVESAPDEIEGSALNKWIFNTDTVDKVLTYLMENGIKVNGEHVGKTIIFAKNHKHAEFIEKRFNKLYPEFSGKLLRVIDNYEPRAQDLLETFCDKEKDTNPVIAVSVDMMDTGVDAPRVVNLVFFKIVRSVSKFWQMIGRGTRVRPDLFGPGMDKQCFYIFDFCENLKFFDENTEGITPSPTLTLTEQIFIAQLEISQKLLHEKFQEEELQKFRVSYLDNLHELTSKLDRSRFVVRKSIQYVEEYAQRERWDELSRTDINNIVNHLAHLPDVSQGGDEYAKRFDVQMFKLITYLLENDKRQQNSIQKLMTIGTALLKKQNIPQVAKHADLLKTFTEPEYWADASITAVEEIRQVVRNLIKFLDPVTIQPVYTRFTDDLIETELEEFDLVKSYRKLKSYKDRVESFIRKNSHHVVISKLRNNIPITTAELELLEQFLFDGDERGTKEDFQKEFGDQPLGAFIRSIIGLDVEAARAAFADFLHQGNLSPNQITFIDLIIEFLTQNGVIDKQLLFKPPFTDMHDQGAFGIFEDSEVRKVISIVDKINENAEIG